MRFEDACPGCPRGRPRALGHRAGIPALADGRPTWYHRRAARPAQDGAIDGSTPRDDSGIRDIEPARLRFDDGIRPFITRRSRGIAAGQDSGAKMPTLDRATGHDPQIQYERGSAGIPGHAKPARDSRLKSRAFGAKTAGAARSFGQTGDRGLAWDCSGLIGRGRRVMTKHAETCFWIGE